MAVHGPLPLELGAPLLPHLLVAMSQLKLVGAHQKDVSVADFLLRNKSLAEQLTVFEFDTTMAEIVATEKLLPRQKPRCACSFPCRIKRNCCAAVGWWLDGCGFSRLGGGGRFRGSFGSVTVIYSHVRKCTTLNGAIQRLDSNLGFGRFLSYELEISYTSRKMYDRCVVFVSVGFSGH